MSNIVRIIPDSGSIIFAGNLANISSSITGDNKSLKIDSDGNLLDTDIFYKYLFI